MIKRSNIHKSELPYCLASSHVLFSSSIIPYVFCRSHDHIFERSTVEIKMNLWLIYVKTFDNINWRYVQKKNVVNNVDMSSLRASWQNGPYKNQQTERLKNRQNSMTQQTFTINYFLCCCFLLCFLSMWCTINKKFKWRMNFKVFVSFLRC